MRKKNNLDEMQERTLLQIESKGMWFVFWGLLASMVIQLVLYGVEEASQCIIGEWVVFMCLCLYMIIGCMRSGIWDRKYKPDSKTNMKMSFIGSFLAGGVMGIINFRTYQMVGGAIAVFVCYFIMLFVIIFITLSLAAVGYKKRFNKLEKGDEEDSEIE